MGKPLESLKSPLKDLLSWLKAAKAKGVIVGGVAASLLGRPRFTRDVDALVILDETHWKTFLTSGKKFGFEPRMTNCIKFAQEKRVLLVTHIKSKIDVDIIFAGLPYEEELIDRAVQVKVDTFNVPLPTPEDLIVMKSLAMRPRDVGDIEGLIDAHAKLDLKHIRFWVGEFATALENPELLTQIETLIKRSNRKGK